MRWSTWFPLYSSTASSICAQMTPTEKRRFVRRSIRHGVWFGLTAVFPIAVAVTALAPMFLFNSHALCSPRPTLLVMSGILGLYLVGEYLALRRQRAWLSSTAWAVEQGYHPSRFSLFSATGRTSVAILWTTMASLAVMGVIWPYVPGTMYFDEYGFSQGTGWHTVRYASGKPMLEERYFDGVLKYSRWYRPDGSLIAESNWDRPHEVGYFLKEDGSIGMTMECKYNPIDNQWIADGKKNPCKPCVPG